MKFKYTEFIKNRGKQSGLITSSDQKEALAFLQNQGKVIVSLKAVKENFLTKTIIFNKSRLIAGFTESLSSLLSAGIPLVDSLEIVFQEEKSKYMKGLVKGIITDLKKGRSLYASLSGLNFFPSLYCSMIRVGEETGKLKIILSQLNAYVQKKIELREKVLSSLYYPFLLIGLSVLTLFYLVLHVLPEFFLIFEGFNVPLPLITRVLMGAVRFTRNYLILIITGIGAAGFLLYRYIKTENGYYSLERAALKIPQLNHIYRTLLNINFFKPLNLLLKNKVNLSVSLEILKQTVKSVILKRIIDNIIVSLKKGYGINPGKEGASVFPLSTLQMFSIGERSGKISEIIETIEHNISEKAEQDIKRIVVLIEPVLILAIGLVIGFIVMSALLPIYSISTMVR